MFRKRAMGAFFEAKCPPGLNSQAGIWRKERVTRELLRCQTPPRLGTA